MNNRCKTEEKEEARKCHSYMQGQKMQIFVVRKVIKILEELTKGVQG